MPGGRPVAMAFIANIKQVQLKTLPCGAPHSCMIGLDRENPTLNLECPVNQESGGAQIDVLMYCDYICKFSPRGIFGGGEQFIFNISNIINISNKYTKVNEKHGESCNMNHLVNRHLSVTYHFLVRSTYIKML